ncbi:MAG: alpha/beta hydrolase [Tannerellaceae bacterium]|nr:alpha/beta hydrolase [Tannerellaceae bacterium]
MKKIIFPILLVIACHFYTYAQADEKFYAPDKDWNDLEFTNYEDIYFPVEGDTIHGVFIKPLADPKGTIVYFYGKQANLSKWTKQVEPLINQGHQVGMMDYRGYGRSTGTPTHLNMASDGQAFLELLAERDEVKDKPIVLYGASVGSHVASQLARENSERIRGLVLESPMPTFEDREFLNQPPGQHEQISKYAVSPYSVKDNVPFLRDDMPILFIHSEDDPMPVEAMEEMYESACCMKDFWLHKGEHIGAATKYPDMFIIYIDQIFK